MQAWRDPKEDLKMSLGEALYASFAGFMTHTSMHGMKYVCEDGRKSYERVCWLVVISIGIVSASLMVISIYNRYSDTPTMTNIEHTHYPSWRLPFPGVTICNTNRILRSKAEALVDQLVLPKGTSKHEVLEKLKMLGQLSEPEFPADAEFEKMQTILQNNRFTIADIMKEMGQNCKEMFEKCSWKSQIVNCSDLFEIRKTHIGFCCSFNYIGVKDNPPRTHAEQLLPVPGSPEHSRLFGQRTGLSLLINPMTHEYFVSSFNSAGLKLIIHDSRDYPNHAAVEKMIPLEKEVMVPIMTSALLSSDSVRDLPPSVRHCLFADEQPLRFFPEFSNHNCYIECAMNYSLELCGCLPYYYPDNGMYRVCDLTDVQCFYENFDYFHTRRPGWSGELAYEELKHMDLQPLVHPMRAMSCHCPSQCSYIEYDVEISVGDFKAARTSVNPFFLTETNVTDRILVHVFLESNFARLLKRDTMYSWVDLLSSLGGVTSLFLGCSFVTLIELLYFFTVRLTTRLPPHSSREECPFTAQRARPARKILVEPRKRGEKEISIIRGITHE